MKKTLNYILETDAQDCQQGDEISGKLSIRNLGTEVESLDSLNVCLAYGVFKEIKEAEDENPWYEMKELKLVSNLDLGPQESQTFEWTIKVPSNSPISDKNGTLFLLYGNGNFFKKGGRLDLQVTPSPIIKSFLQTFETQFNFSRKYLKYKDDGIEVKLGVPESKQFSNLKQTICFLSVQEDSFFIDYDFKVETLGRADSGNLGVKKKKKQIHQEFKASQYLLPGNFPNRRLFQKSIDEALETVRSAFILIRFTFSK